MSIEIFIMGAVWLLVLVLLVYGHRLQDWIEYRRAHREIFAYMKKYSNRCGKANRFIVTIEVLQEIFNEYDTVTLTKIWEELVDKKIVMRDPADDEWCIR